MASILKRWKRAGYSRGDIQGMYVAGQILKGNIGPQMKATLKRYGLQDLTRWVADAVVQGKSQDQIMLEIYDQPAFKKRFPAIAQREAIGFSPVSVEDYINYEKLAESLGSTWGVKLSKAEVDDLIGHDVSAQELEQRFNIAATAVYESAPETRNALNRLFNISGGELMRYWMNPKKQFGDLQQKYRMGEIAGAAMRTSYGEIAGSEARQLMEAGLDEGSALEGFSTLTNMRSLFKPIHGGESLISRQEQLDFLMGDVEAAQAIERRTRSRIATFAGRSGFAPGEEGFTTGEAVQP